MGKKKMRKQNERGHGEPEKPQLMVTSFAACTALGLLYGRYILGPSISSPHEGIAIGISIGVGAGVSIGAILEGERTLKQLRKSTTNF